MRLLDRIHPRKYRAERVGLKVAAGKRPCLQSGTRREDGVARRIDELPCRERAASVTVVDDDMRQVSGTIQYGVRHLRLEIRCYLPRLAHKLVEGDLQCRHIEVAADADMRLPQLARFAAGQQTLLDFFRDSADDLAFAVSRVERMPDWDEPRRGSAAEKAVIFHDRDGKTCARSRHSSAHASRRTSSHHQIVCPRHRDGPVWNLQAPYICRRPNGHAGPDAASRNRRYEMPSAQRRDESFPCCHGSSHLCLACRKVICHV